MNKKNPQCHVSVTMVTESGRSARGWRGSVRVAVDRRLLTVRNYLNLRTPILQYAGEFVCLFLFGGGGGGIVDFHSEEYAFLF